MIIAIGHKKQVGKDTVGKIIQYLYWLKDNKHDEKLYTFEDFLNGDYLNTNPNFKIKKFALKLKQIVALLISCSLEDLEDEEFKNKELGEDWIHTYYNTKDGDVLLNEHLLSKKEAEMDLAFYQTIFGDSATIETITIKYTPRLLLQHIGTDLFRNQLLYDIWVKSLMSDYKIVADLLLEGEVRIVREEDLIYPDWIITDMRFPNEFEAVKAKGGITIKINRNVQQNPKIKLHYSEFALDKHKFDYIIDNNGTIEQLIQKVKKILIKEKIL